MSVKKSDVRKAAGKLISVVQKEWGDELGEPGAIVSEEVMHNCHGLLDANSPAELAKILNGMSIAEYLGLKLIQRFYRILQN